MSLSTEVETLQCRHR